MKEFLINLIRPKEFDTIDEAMHWSNIEYYMFKPIKLIKYLLRSKT